ncbi:GntR family transcriptional regulator [Nonomuraea glycinis]|uniref:GntR family transcriptional regulator n=1 Tax=Nonomuraea glycinis TaxID=2047744 RepID=UPI002E0EF403|nr:GntR family transcriptional regulator [Nonomuraea glycinis]
MQLLLDLDSETPIYQQIRDRMVEAIADGHLAAGAALPSTRQLAVDLAINFHTVNKAYDLLRREGIISINRKSGATVHASNSPPPGPRPPPTGDDAPAHCSPRPTFADCPKKNGSNFGMRLRARLYSNAVLPDHHLSRTVAR